MLTVDLHVHSLFSACGLHTILELMEEARRIGLKAMAITDHGPAVGGSRINSVFFERFRSPWPDLTLYKGLELNVLADQGKIDLPWEYLPFVDILLLGVHHNLTAGKSSEFYTDLALAAMEKNPFVDIITHPNDPAYALEFRRMAKQARALGMALELNNSKILYKRSNAEVALELLHACKEAGCLISVDSDTHALLELGNDEAVRPILEQANFPDSHIVNRDYDSAARFIGERRALKRAAWEKRREEMAKKAAS